MLHTFLLTVLLLQTPNGISPEIDYGKKSTLGRYVESTNVSERKRAYNYALNSIIGIRRQKMKPYLVHVVSKGAPPQYGPVTSQVEEYASRRVALSILAEWQDPSLIPLFLEFIVYQAFDPNRSPSTDSIGNAPLTDSFAAVKGLINIGSPALEPTLRELIKSTIPTKFNSNGDSYKTASVAIRFENLIYVIWCILGYEGAKDYLTKEIEKLDKTDQKAAEKVREALKFLEKNYAKRWNG